MASLGFIFLICAVAVALVHSLFGFSRKLVWLYMVLVGISISSLIASFLLLDLSIVYVAANVHHDLAWYYRISAIWGGHEGSLLLWFFIYGIWLVILSCQLSIPQLIHTTSLRLGSAIFSLFGVYIIWASNPFIIHPISIPAVGADLNPLLQDIGLIVHPPMLYTGYTALILPFVLAISCLWHRSLVEFVPAAKRFVHLAFAMMSFGVALGSAWAYYELGWGGFWFWDPVENASLMPWLVSVALLHSLKGAQKDSYFINWSIALSIIAFVLSLLGLFLVRSGILTSVHAFASSPERGILLLCMLAIILIPSFVLLCQRTLKQPFVGNTKNFFYLGALYLALFFLIVVLVGTLAPLAFELMAQQAISVGAPYFNQFAYYSSLILLSALVVLHAVTVQLWQQSLKLTTLFGAIVIIGALVVGAYYANGAYLVIALALLVIIGNLYQLIIAGLSKSILAHLGISILIIGAVGSTYFLQQTNVELSIGSQVNLGSKSFTLAKIEQGQTKTYKYRRAHILVDDGAILYPEKRLYNVRRNFSAESAIDNRWWGDIHISMGATETNSSVFSIRLIPGIHFLWLGALMIGISGIYRKEYKL